MPSSGSFHLESYPVLIAATANATEDRGNATGFDLSWGKGGDEQSVVCNSTATTLPPPAGNSAHNCVPANSNYHPYKHPVYQLVSEDQKNVTIYFSTWRGGIKVYSEGKKQRNEVETFVQNKEDLIGLAWDPKGQHHYSATFSSPSKIYTANADGTEFVNVFNSSECE